MPDVGMALPLTELRTLERLPESTPFVSSEPVRGLVVAAFDLLGTVGGLSPELAVAAATSTAVVPVFSWNDTVLTSSRFFVLTASAPSAAESLVSSWSLLFDFSC